MASFWGPPAVSLRGLPDLPQIFLLYFLFKTLPALPGGDVESPLSATCPAGNFGVFGSTVEVTPGSVGIGGELKNYPP